MIFIDTGAFLGRFLEADPYHDQALRLWDELAGRKERFITSNFILDETFTLMARRAGYRYAAEKARRLYATPALLILRPTEENELSALSFFTKYADQKMSFTDCISFALMRAHALRRVFSFDRHFRDAGFETIPPF